MKQWYILTKYLVLNTKATFSHVTCTCNVHSPLPTQVRACYTSRGRTNLEISHEYINYTTASTGSLFYLKTSGCHFLSAYHINAAYSSDTPPPHTLRPAQTGNDRWHLSDKIMTCTISATQDITESLMKHAVKSCVLETQIQIMRRLTTGMRSEKCVVRRFRRCANVYWQEPR